MENYSAMSKKSKTINTVLCLLALSQLRKQSQGKQATLEVRMVEKLLNY